MGVNEMSQKAVQKQREQASALVQSGETVRHAVAVSSGPLFALSLGPLGVALMKFRALALTDDALYVLSQKAASGQAKAVEQRMPLGSVAVRTDTHPFPLQSRLVVGDQKWNVAKPFKEGSSGWARGRWRRGRRSISSRSIWG